MIYKLSSLDVSNLTDLPETGMGYQVVKARKIFETEEKIFIVYNSQLAIIDDLEFKSNKNELKKEKFSSILSKAEPLMLSTSIKVLNEDEARNLSNVKKDSFSVSKIDGIWHKRNSGGQGAIDNPNKELANGKDIFVRVSAYEDDIRIDFVNKKLKPGSYTTTEQDYKDCIAHDNPIERYALPNEEKIAWAFYIKPNTTDSLQKGIVQPAFGHSGGGIEVYFVDGTSTGTFLEKKTYGQ